MPKGPGSRLPNRCISLGVLHQRLQTQDDCSVRQSGQSPCRGLPNGCIAAAQRSQEIRHESRIPAQVQGRGQGMEDLGSIRLTKSAPNHVVAIGGAILNEKQCSLTLETRMLPIEEHFAAELPDRGATARTHRPRARACPSQAIRDKACPCDLPPEVLRPHKEGGI